MTRYSPIAKIDHFKIKGYISYPIGLLLIALMLSACADHNRDEQVIYENDPYEKTNRDVFAFNLGVDDYVIEPAGKAFRTLPQSVQSATADYIEWTSLPSTAVNSLAQGKFENAALASFTFMINALSFGFVDLMEGEDKPEQEDFGQTLASAGMPTGPYLMLPFLGSHTGRSATGRVVDFVINPLGGLRSSTIVQTASVPLSAVSIRARYFDEINEVKYNSLDPYIQTRSTYYQLRQALLRDNLSDNMLENDDYFDSFFDDI